MRQKRRRKDSPELTMTKTENVITNLSGAVAAPGAPVAPVKASAKKTANSPKDAPQSQKASKGGDAKSAAQKPAKGGKTAPKATGRAKTPSTETKGGKILELIGRPKGASLAEIIRATRWQAHSVRGFLSTAARKYSLRVESRKTESGDRVYQLKRR